MFRNVGTVDARRDRTTTSAPCRPGGELQPDRKYCAGRSGYVTNAELKDEDNYRNEFVFEFIRHFYLYIYTTVSIEPRFSIRTTNNNVVLLLSVLGYMPVLVYLNTFTCHGRLLHSGIFSFELIRKGVPSGTINQNAGQIELFPRIRLLRLLLVLYLLLLLLLLLLWQLASYCHRSCCITSS